MPSYTVKHVIFYTPLNPGNLLLCECVDGVIRLFRDDKAVEGQRWTASNVAKGIIAYQEMKASLIGEPDAE